MNPKPIIILFLILSSLSVNAIPTFQIFQGTVKLNGENAPSGTVIEAYIQDDDDPEDADGTETLSSTGTYHLIVGSDDSDMGKTIVFRIDGTTADQTAGFLTGGQIIDLNLTASGGATTTTIQECTTEGDTPPCGEVTLGEVIDYITLWNQGDAELEDVIDLISLWASG